MRASDVKLVDEALGGVAPGFPLVIRGASGTGRTVLALELAAAALARGDRVVFVTAMPPALLVRHAASLGVMLEPALRDGSLVLLELDPAVASSVRSFGGERFAAALRAEAPGAALLVIDPLTALTGEMRDEGPVRALVRAVFEPDASQEQVVVVTAESDRMRPEPHLERALGDLCGAQISLQRASDGQRSLRVEKSRAGMARVEHLEFVIGSGGTAVVEGAAWVREAAAPSTPRSPTSAPHAAARRPRVLVVDDDAVSRRLIADWLADHCEVTEAADGFAAMTQLLAQLPDAVVLDLVLPRVGGSEVLSAMAQAGIRTPVLVVSGRMARAADRVRALALGASDVLPKPLQRLELVHKVETLLALARAPSQAPLFNDAAELLGSAGPSRMLTDATFVERLERAVRFGAEAALSSTLLALQAQSGDALDAAIAVTDRTLRTEDAILLVSERRALILLVASPPEATETVIGRLETRMRASNLDPSQLGWRASLAAVPKGDEDGASRGWKRCFDGTSRRKTAKAC